MQNPGIILIIIPWVLLCLSSRVALSSETCPEGQGCICINTMAGEKKVECTVSQDTAFLFTIKPRESILVNCQGPTAPDWSEFRLRGHPWMRDVTSIQFQRCRVPPPGTSFRDITRRLGAEKIVSLGFTGCEGGNLTREHFENFSTLTRLTLSYNSIGSPPEDLLEELPNLLYLDLHSNEIQELPSGDFFRRVPNLGTLELGFNRIERIPAGAFRHLGKLRRLYLWKNPLREVHPEAFANLSSLTVLNLQRNSLEELPVDLFLPLTSLQTLSMFSGTYRSIPEGLFRHNRLLETVNLHSNREFNLTVIPRGLFSNLTKLRNVDLKRNGIRTLPEDLFWGSGSLTKLILQYNDLPELPELLFRDSAKLENLVLSHNRLENIPDRLFSRTNELKVLDLSANGINGISSHALEDLPLLEELNMDTNRLTTLSSSSFSSLGKLKIARFADNQLSLAPERDRDSRSPFNFCDNLEELYLARNNVTGIFDDWILSTKLRVLDLRYNSLESLTSQDLMFLSDNIEVDLRDNQISEISLRDAEIIAETMTSSVRHNRAVKIDGNPINCNCRIYDYLLYREGKLHPYVFELFRLESSDDLLCHGPADLGSIQVNRIKSSNLMCLLEDESRCPRKCSCYYKPVDKATLVDCSHRNLTRVPLVNLTGEVRLDLSGNLLTGLSGLEAFENRGIGSLVLRDNRISDIKLEELSRNLTVLDLSNNRIRRLSGDVLRHLGNDSSLKKLSLGGNPWDCDCRARELLNFVQSRSSVYPELLNVNCASSPSKPMYQMTPSEFCLLAGSSLMIGLSCAVAATGLFLGILAALYYRYQREIKVWLYARNLFLWWVTEEELDRDKTYDAFVSYSHKDEEFIVNELLPKLESGPKPFKVCVHFRDWLAGEWIPTQIARSVENSRRTIVVLSPNFLESVWGRMEFRAAHSQALSEGRARVIVVLYGDIGKHEDLDDELRAYLSMNTYVKWGDPWFWDKLRYALPHPSEVARRTKSGAAMASRRIFESNRHALSLQLGDKKEPFKPETPVSTTPPSEKIVAEFASTDFVRNHCVLDVVDLHKAANGVVPNYDGSRCGSGESSPSLRELGCTTV